MVLNKKEGFMNSSFILFLNIEGFVIYNTNGLVQERRNSSVLALQLLALTHPYGFVRDHIPRPQKC